MLGVVLAAVTAQGFLILQPGETAIFHLEGTRPVLDRTSNGTEAPPYGSLSAAMAIDVPGGPKGTMLKIVNNTDDSLDYEAGMILGAAARPTSVCTLMNHNRLGFEHWPYRLDALAIGNFQHHAGDKVACK